VQEKKFDAANQLQTLYDKLSASVHGRRVENLETRKALNRIVYDEETIGEQIKDVEKCVAASNFLLASFHAVKFLKLRLEDRQIILHTMPTKARQVIAGLH
jgi:hypothetical protein